MTDDLRDDLLCIVNHLRSQLIETKAELLFLQENGGGRAGGWPPSRAWEWYARELRERARAWVDGKGVENPNTPTEPPADPPNVFNDLTKNAP